MSKVQPYVGFARKYRPQTFAEVLGQEAAGVTIANALEAQRLAHAYLFTGPRGVGKTTMARLLAKALNCAKGAGPKPCLECASCKEVAASSSIDVLEMDAASHTGVDNVREVIIETVALAPSRDRFKIFIIDETHMLSTAAFNALLKTLEEPPPHVVFILATTELAKVPATIVSRCQRFRFKPIAVELLQSHLADLCKREKISAAPEALAILARSAGGSLRDAVSLLDQACTFSEGKLTADSVRGMFGFAPQELVLDAGRAILGRDAKALLAALGSASRDGVEPAQLLKDLRESLEGVYLAALGAGEPPAGWEGLSASAPAVGYLLRRINKTLEELRQSDSPQLTLELGLLSCLEAAGDLGQWLERLERLEKSLSQGGPIEAPAPARVEAPARREAPARPEAPAAPQGDAWKSLLAALAEKPSLLAALEGAQAIPGPGVWKIVFKRDFERNTAERGLSVIEAKLATILGKTPKIIFEVGPSRPAPASAPSAERPAAPEPEPAGPAWQDASEGPAEASNESPLKKAEKILGGTMKFIKKK